jgi:hypothetical protein
MRISEMTQDDAKQCLYDSYMAFHNAIAGGDAEGPHPSKDLTRWRSSVGATDDNSGLGPKYIQKRGSSSEEGGSDDVQPRVTGGLGNKMPAQDSFSIGTDSVPRFETADGRVLLGNDAIEANARRSNPSRAANMASRIKGYNRIP